MNTNWIPRLRGVTDLVTAGGPHSNHCRVTAAAAARLGLGCTLVINGEPEDAGRGNALLHSAGDEPALRGDPAATHGGPPGPSTRGGAPVWIFTSASSGGTLAGLMLGCALMGWRAQLIERVRDVAAATLVTDAFVGPGYGAPTRAAEEAIALFGARAGVILDTVYTGKAAAAMISWVRQGKVPAGAHVIFLHTGGHPALFR